jgi:hypothetical protein
MTADIMSAGPWQPSKIPTPSPAVPQPPDLRLHFSVPDFGTQFAAPLVDLRTKNDYSEVVMEAFIDEGVTARLTLRNEPAKDAYESLQIKEASLRFEVSQHSARAHFFGDSLYAVVALAEGVTISLPGTGLDIGLQFKMPLSEISTMLQLRQIYFGMIVVERATGLKFDVPKFIPGEDIDSISFSYHAIVAREFRWLCNEVMLEMPATDESLTWISNLQPTEPGGSVYKVMFGPRPRHRTIFGQTVALGDETIFIDDAVIQNREEVLRELSPGDGHIVPVKFRPLSRKGRYVLPQAPTLPDEPWDEGIVGCVELEDALNERLAGRYNELAASTLIGLPPEEIEALTVRPALDEDAHLIGD